MRSTRDLLHAQQQRQLKNKTNLTTYDGLSYLSVKYKGEVKFKVRRKMAVINGIPMYRSSGRNSKLPNTWMPFLGINGKANKSKSRSWLMKPHHMHSGSVKFAGYFPLTVINLIGKFVKRTDKQPECGKSSDSILGRFGNLKALAVSASIGGGFWQEAEGMQLKQHLLEKHPHLMIKPGVKIKRVGKVIKEKIPGDQELSRKREMKAIKKANQFIGEHHPHPHYFHSDRNKRRKVYESYPENATLNSSSISRPE